MITVTGEVVQREGATINPKLPTGEIELRVRELVVQSAAEVLPIQVAGEQDSPEEMRLRYRFLDLRRESLHRNMMLRAQVIQAIRRADDRHRLHRVPDADPDGLAAPRARATSWCRRGCIPASSTPCRRRRSSSSS